MNPEELSKVELLGKNAKEKGTFKDSLNEPVHDWYRYPTGYSFQLIRDALNIFSISEGDYIIDPFTGVGTTNVVAKRNGVNSVGVEAHPFIYKIAKSKVYWDYKFSQFKSFLKEFLDKIENKLEKIEISHPNGEEKHDSIETNTKIDIENIPELLKKCYLPKTLIKSFVIRDEIKSLKNQEYKDFLFTVLTGILRKISVADTGWPYVLPEGKNTKENIPDVYETFESKLWHNFKGVRKVKDLQSKNPKCEIVSGDARDLRFTESDEDPIDDESMDLAITSPPYLNNYDYADRTRLEMYFWGEASTWSDITEQVREKLMMSATTQVKRRNYDLDNFINENIVDEVHAPLEKKVKKLTKKREERSGSKSYDIMVGQYFNDIYENLKEIYRVLKLGNPYILVLGDSAPYGIHIPTDKWIGKIGKAIGFRSYEIVKLRERGGKWKSAPTHNKKLRETLLALNK